MRAPTTATRVRARSHRGGGARARDEPEVERRRGEGVLSAGERQQTARRMSSVFALNLPFEPIF